MHAPHRCHQGPMNHTTRILSRLRRTYQRIDAWSQRHWRLLAAAIVGVLVAWLT